MKKFLGVPVINTGINWKGAGFNILEFAAFFLIPAFLFIELMGYTQVTDTPFYIGLLAGLIGFTCQHVFKLLANKYRRTSSFYNRTLNFFYLLIITLGALALFEVWGM